MQNKGLITFASVMIALLSLTIISMFVIISRQSKTISKTQSIIMLLCLVALPGFIGWLWHLTKEEYELLEMKPCGCC